MIDKDNYQTKFMKAPSFKRKPMYLGTFDSAISSGGAMPITIIPINPKNLNKEKIMRNPKTATPFDIEIGNSIRFHRIRRGFSMQDLAVKLGITHQQIAKYEVAKNRVTASRLYEIGDILNVDIITFFDSKIIVNDNSRITINIMAKLHKMDNKQLVFMNKFLTSIED